ncbi:MAG: ATP-dependent DNA helicase RecG [Armatimonadetes bacterium]|nr:ATP-dependent DNA helicase RecG [Armatimonadota bacterium]
MARSLDTEAQYLKGVGSRFANAMAKAGLRTVRDVLYRVPRRYEDRRALPPIRSLKPGQFATVKGRITHFEGRPTRGGMVILKASVSDGTGLIELTWFNQPWIKRALGAYKGEIIAYGMVKEAQWGYEMNSPEFETLGEDDDPEEFLKIVPVYPLVDGLSQKTMRKAGACAASEYADLVQDPLPAWLRKQFDLLPLADALRELHLPSESGLGQKARRRLVFDEFLDLQLTLQIKRQNVEAEAGISFPIPLLESGGRITQDSPGNLLDDVREETPLWDQIHTMLPFELTGAQRRVIKEIFKDMATPHPMNRLVQGDVGSGKTAVAACAMLAAARSGYQAVLMAPTEILAEQHHANLVRLFESLGLEVALMVGKLTPNQKRQARERVAAGRAHLAVGTQALIQEGVVFAKLGLVVIDEQHRFGVVQRAALRAKGQENPDVLVMTATPIPRTLTMALYGDLDQSRIDEMPAGRLPIKTHWKLPSDRPAVYEAVKKLLVHGRQAYFVCPLVSESEKMLAQAAEDLHYRLSHYHFTDYRVGLLHGQMKAQEKDQIMEQFRRHELDILVASTVIEVGVDVPNASSMVIEDANRFGLSQLHQLRGRVGRGSHQSYCVLIADAQNDDARRRMEIMVETTDGFKIAEEDLRLRGPGELIGTRQSGNLGLEIADLIADVAVLDEAREAAVEIVKRDPKLMAKESQALLKRIKERHPEEALIAIS